MSVNTIRSIIKISLSKLNNTRKNNNRQISLKTRNSEAGSKS